MIPTNNKISYFGFNFNRKSTNDFVKSTNNLSRPQFKPPHNANSDTRKIEFRQSPAKLNHNIDLSTLLTILVEKFDVLICAKLV